ncbi:Pten [Sergentomyia squamirostris]
MANTISNMKMTNPIKGLVSKRKKRYTEDGYNLDLSYIDKNLIAMAFPAEKLVEAVYRNNIDDVLRLLESKHSGSYKIYNLCSERTYDYSKFQNRVACYPFNDHNPPTIELIKAFCDDVQKFLSDNTNNVAAVHCKAGKGRTGTMICCYLLHVRRFTSAADALSFYGQQRTHDEKGVTIPSQRRYVEYYSRLLKSRRPYSEVKLLICELKLSPPPLLNSHQGSVFFSITNGSGEKLHRDSVSDVKRSQGNGDGQIVIKLDRCIPLTGDIQVEFYSKGVIKKEKLFHFWFNTYFVNEETEGNIPAEGDSSKLVYRIKKFDLDDAHKDKQHKIFPPDFEVQVILQRIPSDSYDARGTSHHHNNHSSNNLHHVNHRNSQNNTSTVAAPTLNSHPGAHTPSESSEASCTDSSTEEDGWESGELSTPTTAANASSSLFNYTSPHLLSDFVSNVVLANDSSLYFALSPSGDETPSVVGGEHGGDDEGEKIPMETMVETKRSFTKRRKRRERSKTPQSQFKARSTSVKVVAGSPGSSHHNHQSRSQKMRWLSNMRSDPDFRETLAKSVVFRPPHSTESLDSTDFYSSLCDKQLSIGSPCKSASDLTMAHQTNGQKSQVDDTCRLLVAKPVESHSIGFNIIPPSPPPSPPTDPPPSATHSTHIDGVVIATDDSASEKIPNRNRTPFTFRELRHELQYVIKHNHASSRGGGATSASGARKSPDKMTSVKKKKRWGKS